MLLCGIDFETTFGSAQGFDFTQMRVYEIGAVLWDTERKLPLAMMNRVVWDADIESKFDERCTALTGLTIDDLHKYGRTPHGTFVTLTEMMREASYCMAHNGTNFDKPLLVEEAKRHALTLPEKLWLDTTVDVPYPARIETRKLEFLAPCHGFINPFSHRAVFDVLAMLRVQSNYPIEETIKRATAQKVTLKAVTAKPWHDAGKSNAEAKARGFRFDGDTTKLWLKIVLADEVAAELAKPGLQVEVYK